MQSIAILEITLRDQEGDLAKKFGHLQIGDLRKACGGSFAPRMNRYAKLKDVLDKLDMPSLLLVGRSAGAAPPPESSEIILIDERPGNGSLDGGGGAFIGVAEQVRIDVQGDRGVGMAEAAADGHHVETGGDELACVRVTERM